MQEEKEWLGCTFSPVFCQSTQGERAVVTTKETALNSLKTKQCIPQLPRVLGACIRSQTKMAFRQACHSDGKGPFGLFPSLSLISSQKPGWYFYDII